jgi:nucleotide-binding universal stress UspA family protein
MFKKILVPLDGSHLAEAALPAALSLSEKLNAQITLLHVIEQNAPEVVHNEPHLSRPEQADAYLENLAERSFPAKIKAKWHVHNTEVKNVTDSIVEHTDEFKPDLVIMCAHGRSGIRDMLFGRIAQQVVAKGSTPVLLLQPMTAQGKTFNLCTTIVFQSQKNWRKPIMQNCICYASFQHSALCVEKKLQPARFCLQQPMRFWISTKDGQKSIYKDI